MRTRNLILIAASLAWTTSAEVVLHIQNRSEKASNITGPFDDGLDGYRMITLSPGGDVTMPWYGSAEFFRESSEIPGFLLSIGYIDTDSLPQDRQLDVVVQDSAFANSRTDTQTISYCMSAGTADVWGWYGGGLAVGIIGMVWAMKVRAVKQLMGGGDGSD